MFKTRQEIKEAMLEITNSHRFWIGETERTAAQLEILDRYEAGAIVCFETSYCGQPQGIVQGSAWKDKAFTSGRVFYLGTLTE